LLELDHVLIATLDLAATSRALESRFGLRSIEGGSHPGWGTQNRIVCLGNTYLELISVTEPRMARANAFGRWVERRSSTAGALLGWAVRTDQIGDVSGRLGIGVESGSRARPDGSMLHWRLAGLEEAASEPSLPFFIQWEVGSVHPGRASAAQGRMDELQLTGNVDRLSSWLGSSALPVTIVAGDPAVASVRISTTGGRSILLDDG